MNRAEFMARLRELLSDITEAEREEALTYYEDYFDDAGVENEASVIGSLGSPEKVAATIKHGLNDNTGEDGEFSENGYSGHTYDKDEIATTSSNKKWDVKGSTLVLIIILCIFALPILGPLFVAVLSVLFGLLAAAAALLFAVMVSGIAIVISGIALFGSGVVTLIQSPVAGILLAGIGLILAGIGILVTILGIWVLKKIVPPLVRGLVDLCKKPFERKRR